MTGLYNSISSHSQCPVVSQLSSQKMPVVLGNSSSHVCVWLLIPDHCSQFVCLCPGGSHQGGQTLRPRAGWRVSGPTSGARWEIINNALLCSMIFLINFLLFCHVSFFKRKPFLELLVKIIQYLPRLQKRGTFWNFLVLQFLFYLIFFWKGFCVMVMFLDTTQIKSHGKTFQLKKSLKICFYTFYILHILYSLRGWKWW